MATCSFCGENTSLYVQGVPICVTCSDLPLAERIKRRQRSLATERGHEPKSGDDDPEGLERPAAS